MKPQLNATAAAFLVGLSCLASGRKLRSHGCWVDDLIGLPLPASCEWLTGALPWIAAGILLAAHAMRSHIK